jgi:VTC domain
VWGPRLQLPGAEELQPVGLEALDAAAALRRRFDVKYLMPCDAVAELLERLRPTHRVLEIDGLRTFEYRTMYFDTRELATFRDHVQGRRRRLKARVRRYVESGACFFELKLRGPRNCTVKRRLAHDPAMADSLTAESVAALHGWVQAAYDRPPPAPLGPVLEVDFRRTTLVALDRGERLTIDIHIGMRTTSGEGSGHLDRDFALIESKSARGLALTTRELNLLGARRLEGMSKYCLGVVLALGRGRGNALLPVLRHCTGYSRPTRSPMVRHSRRSSRSNPPSSLRRWPDRRGRSSTGGESRSR